MFTKKQILTFIPIVGFFVVCYYQLSPEEEGVFHNYDDIALFISVLIQAGSFLAIFHSIFAV